MWGRAKGGSRGQIPGSLASQARPLDLILERGRGGTVTEVFMARVYFTDGHDSSWDGVGVG